MATMPVNAQSLSPQSAAAVARAGSKESRVAWMMQAATKEGHSGIRSPTLITQGPDSHEKIYYKFLYQKLY